MQVIVVPHVPSVLMDWCAEEVVLVLEDVVLVLLTVVVEVFEVVLLVEVQLPDAGWHPAPQ
jgi:hypothetical protein